jgi:hypothetical protein
MSASIELAAKRVVMALDPYSFDYLLLCNEIVELSI